ncbi:hormogonium polysaccharide biosynthesis protein HpsL [Pannus brasiliensis CCIBt3594]|uniref:Hormogonium polysaccharide biosynthesis protein HpsL n=1 Tax=Pannus brasiliensis CCIBt3594 TaxID=1427578 RepID=A0AAW9QLR5_9CHRO
MARSSLDRPKKAIAKTKPSSRENTLDIKEKIALRKEARQKQQKLTGFIIFSVIFAIFVGIPVGLLAGIKSGIALALGVILGVFAFLYPRASLWTFVIYLPFNGTVTYWIGDGSALLQISKDIFYLPALIALVRECRQRKKPIFIPPKLKYLFLILVVFCVIGLFAVNLPFQLRPTCDSVQGLVRYENGQFVTWTPCRKGENFLQGLLGFKVLLGYIPLIFCTYYLIDNKRKLLSLGRILIVLAIICCILGIAQYWMLKTGHCQGTRGYVGDLLYKATLEARCLVGGALVYSPEVNMIRLPGTFVSPWHWGWFLVSNTVICYASAFSETSKTWRLAGIVGLVLVFINAVICGQRLAFISVPVLVVLLFVLTGQIAQLKRFLPVAIGLVLLLAIGFSFINPEFIQERYDSAVSRWQQSPPTAFIQEQFEVAVRNQQFTGILGWGLGSATSSARTFGDITFTESFHSKLIHELGFIGFSIYMAFISYVVFLAFKSSRSLKDPTLRGFASSYWVFLLVVAYLPYWYPLDTDPVGVYYWLFAGVIFRLPDIERQEKEARALAEPTEKPAKGTRLKSPRKGIALV